MRRRCARPVWLARAIVDKQQVQIIIKEQMSKRTQPHATLKDAQIIQRLETVDARLRLGEDREREARHGERFVRVVFEELQGVR
jgi:hypothetical protein